MAKEPRKEMSLETKLIIELLEQTEINEMVTYDMISDLIGRNIHDCIWFLSTARHRLQRDSNIVFDVVMGEGLIKLPENGKRIPREKQREKSRKAQGRAIGIMRTVDLSKLSESEKDEHLTSLAFTNRLYSEMNITRKIIPVSKVEATVVASLDVSERVKEFRKKSSGT